MVLHIFTILILRVLLSFFHNSNMVYIEFHPPDRYIDIPNLLAERVIARVTYRYVSVRFPEMVYKTSYME